MSGHGGSPDAELERKARESAAALYPGIPPGQLISAAQLAAELKHADLAPFVDTGEEPEDPPFGDELIWSFCEGLAGNDVGEFVLTPDLWKSIAAQASAALIAGYGRSDVMVAAYWSARSLHADLLGVLDKPIDILMDERRGGEIEERIAPMLMDQDELDGHVRRAREAAAKAALRREIHKAECPDGCSRCSFGWGAPQETATEGAR
jgi:hypothetical protein